MSFPVISKVFYNHARLSKSSRYFSTYKVSSVKYYISPDQTERPLTKREIRTIESETSHGTRGLIHRSAEIYGNDLIQYLKTKPKLQKSTLTFETHKFLGKDRNEINHQLPDKALTFRKANILPTSGTNISPSNISTVTASHELKVAHQKLPFDRIISQTPEYWSNIQAHENIKELEHRLAQYERYNYGMGKGRQNHGNFQVHLIFGVLIVVGVFIGATQIPVLFDIEFQETQQDSAERSTDRVTAYHDFIMNGWVEIPRGYLPPTVKELISYHISANHSAVKQFRGRTVNQLTGESPDSFAERQINSYDGLSLVNTAGNLVTLTTTSVCVQDLIDGIVFDPREEVLKKISSKSGDITALIC